MDDTYRELRRGGWRRVDGRWQHSIFRDANNKLLVLSPLDIQKFLNTGNAPEIEKYEIEVVVTKKVYRLI